MRPQRLTLSLVFSLVAISPAANAQVIRTWVSGTGDDASENCSRTAPCRTFAGASGKTLDGGEINILDGFGFGPLSITNRSLSVVASGHTGSIVASALTALIVSNSSGFPVNVTLRGLELNGVASGVAGIRVTGSSPVNLHIENGNIFRFANGINVLSNAAVSISVVNSRITDCLASGNGINTDAASGPVQISLIGSEIHNCNTGINLAGTAKINVKNSDLSQNTTGVNVASASATALLDSNIISFCTTAVNVAISGGIVRLTNTTISDNATGLATVPGGSLISFGNNRIKANTVNGAPTAILVQN